MNMYKTALILVKYMEGQMLNKDNNDAYQRSLMRCVSALKGIVKYW